MFLPALALAGLFPSHVASAEECHGISGPFLSPTFPDPSLLLLDDTWYSFGTSNGKDYQGANSTELSSEWSRLDGPILAIDEASWVGKKESGSYGLWAPDVFQRSSDSKFVMYFSAFDKETMNLQSPKRCIGAAISDDITGVYHPVNDFVQCNRTSSGVIDPAWFKDDDDRQYAVYKTEISQNWLELREVSSSGAKESVEWAGNAVKLLEGVDDGGNTEAPYIFKRGDTYFLTYSTHFTGDSTYDVQYATAKSVAGPYTKVKEPLLKTTDAFGCKLIGPGGASFQRDPVGDKDSIQIIFHGLTGAMTMSKRVVYTATVQVDGDKLSIKSS